MPGDFSDHPQAAQWSGDAADAPAASIRRGVIRELTTRYVEATRKAEIEAYERAVRILRELFEASPDLTFEQILSRFEFVYGPPRGDQR